MAVRMPLRVSLAVASGVFFTTCSTPPDLLGRVLDLGRLEVVTRNSPTTYYEGAEGPEGPDYDLALGFADWLGVDLVMRAPTQFTQVLDELQRQEAHMAAAGLSVTEGRREYLRFGPAYQKITPQVVYRAGEPRPRQVEDLIGARIEVVSGSSHVDILEALKQENPGLEWLERGDVESEELLYRVSQREIDYTIADSTEVAVNRRFYPELRVAFDVSAPDAIAWAFPGEADRSLLEQATRYLESLEANGELQRILDRYYGTTGSFDYVGTRIFMRHIDTRLPVYREWFRKAADRHGLDWRLLAAVGYQESHWNPNAVSPTGVRGIMMLTQPTARQMGIADRTDPRSSIFGGARYLSSVRSRIPDRIPEPDRTWMALAAYNVGLGHLEDARILTEVNGYDPDRWIDVREHLPLLSQKRWYSRTKHGYARGREPVVYVDNIRSYYDVLVWMTSDRARGGLAASD